MVDMDESELFSQKPPQITKMNNMTREKGLLQSIVVISEISQQAINVIDPTPTLATTICVCPANQRHYN